MGTAETTKIAVSENIKIIRRIGHLLFFSAIPNLAVGYAAVSAGKHYCTGGEEAIERITAIREKARRVLQGAAVEAYGRLGAYVTRDPVMWRAGVLNLEEFRALAEYLEEQG